MGFRFYKKNYIILLYSVFGYNKVLQNELLQNKILNLFLNQTNLP